MTSEDETSKQGPLTPFAGEMPPAPAWFHEVLAKTPQDFSVEVAGVPIGYRTWGDPSRPGLLLAHGNGAHAHWWDFIAPFLAERYHVAALTFSGMGDSAWRDSYDWDGFVAEEMTVAQAAGLFDHKEPPIIIGHSLGGIITVATGSQYGQHLGGIILIDSPIYPPEIYKDRIRRARNVKPTRVYPDLATALSRFRLAPEQDCENLYLVDYVARHSLREVEGGWTWKFDPKTWARFDYSRLTDYLHSVKCRAGILRGAQSAIFVPEVIPYMVKAMNGAPLADIPEAQHHVLLDQPLALVAGIRTMLANWKGSRD